MALAKVKRHFQITIPQNLRDQFNLAEGDYVEIEKRESELVIRPVKMVHPDQEYFYSKEWQQGEAAADQDLKKGDTLGPFENLKEALNALKTAKT